MRLVIYNETVLTPYSSSNRKKPYYKKLKLVSRYLKSNASVLRNPLHVKVYGVVLDLTFTRRSSLSKFALSFFMGNIESTLATVLSSFSLFFLLLCSFLFFFSLFSIFIFSSFWRACLISSSPSSLLFSSSSFSSGLFTLAL